MHGGHPYYMKMAHDHAGQHSHAGHGHGSTGSVQTTQKPTTSSQNNVSLLSKGSFLFYFFKEPMFLFYDTSKKQWRFAADLGGKKDLFFATEEKSVAKCPADPTAKGTWQAATGTFGR